MWLCTYKNVIDTDVERLQSGNTVLPLSVSEADGLSWADQSNVQPSTSVLLPCYINHSCIYRFSFSIETGSMYQPYASHFFRFLTNSWNSYKNYFRRYILLSTKELTPCTTIRTTGPKSGVETVLNVNLKHFFGEV